MLEGVDFTGVAVEKLFVDVVARSGVLDIQADDRSVSSLVTPVANPKIESCEQL